MARPIFPHELGDPDFAWLLSSYLEQNPMYLQVEETCSPIVLVKLDKMLLSPVPKCEQDLEEPPEIDTEQWRKE